MPLNIIFAGTSTFAVASLEALLQSEHHIIAVYTQPDRPSGRGLKLTESPVKQAALAHGLPILQPATLKEATTQATLAAMKPDLMVVVVYGLLIPKTVLDIPKLGCINIHPSLLPRWRGAAPIQRAIAAGDTETGISIMQLDEGWDTGDILTQTTFPFDSDETSESLHDKLAIKSANQLVETIHLLELGQIKPTPQDHTAAIYAHKLEKTEGNLNWEENATTLANKVRAYNSWPVAYTHWNGEPLRIWEAKALNETTDLPAGTVVRISETGLDVAAGDGSILSLRKIQLPGGKQLGIKDFFHAKGKQFIAGETRFSQTIS